MAKSSNPINSAGNSRSIWATCVCAVSVLMITVTSGVAADQYECTVVRQDAGREEPMMDAPLLRRSDDTLQVVSPGESYYTTDDPGPDGTGWIELYGAQAQRGNSFVGYFQSDNFSCTAL